MASSSDHEQRQPLNVHDLNAPDLDRAPTPARSPPPVFVSPSPPAAASSRHRIGYARTPSISFLDNRHLSPGMDPPDINEATAKDASVSRGLGIDVGSDSPSRTPPPPAIKRTPVGGKRASQQATPESGKPLFSPASTAGLSGSTRFEESIFEDIGISYDPTHDLGKQSSYSLNSINVPSVSQSSVRGLLSKSGTTSIREQYDAFHPTHLCSSAKHFRRGMNNWLAITIIMLSIFSTVFSGAFLIIALRAPRYDMIGTQGTLTISSAAFLTSLFAKMIELSFATVAIAFIGQSLARRAFKREPQSGVTLAEISMRNWIAQPGTMFTHWESVRYAAPSWLGLIALLSAIMALLYTSAATALVQPQLKFSGWDKRALQGPVMAQFANSPYLESICKTPITANLDAGDDETTQQTCISNEHAAQAYHNYFHWIGHWRDVAFAGNGSRDQAARPAGWALLNDNTTITAPWIEQQPPKLSPEGFFINNITMAMPHPGVVLAAVDPENHIPQPEELNGLGIYSIRASVPSPFINVLCVSGMSKDQLSPMIWNSWNNSKGSFDASTWPEQLGKTTYDWPYLGGTLFDDIFLWGDAYGSYNWPPVFPKLPGDYNTIINDTRGLAVSWGRTSVYILGKGGDLDATAIPTENNYALCQLQVGQTPNCSTRYNASSSVGTLEALCEDSSDDMRYIKSLKNASSGRFSLSAEWPNVASMWATALELNTGYFDSNGTNPRLLTEFILTNNSIDYSLAHQPPALSIALPSPAEALAVMAGCTLLQSAQDAPFVEFWNYSLPTLDEPQIQWFNASIRAQQYASGGMWGYQKAFFIVLFAVVILNLFILGCWIVHREWYQDFSDPTNLFGLAINSPPSQKLAESSCCALDASGGKFKQHWKIENHDGHVVMESPEITESHELSDSPGTRRRSFKFTRLTNRG